MTWLDHCGLLPAVPGEYRPEEPAECPDCTIGGCLEHATDECSVFGCREPKAAWCAECQHASCKWHSGKCDNCGATAGTCCGVWWSEGAKPWHESRALCRGCGDMPRV
jgi:hypothetical protein